jgi:hypothetical protein
MPTVFSGLYFECSSVFPSSEFSFSPWCGNTASGIHLCCRSKQLAPLFFGYVYFTALFCALLIRLIHWWEVGLYLRHLLYEYENTFF